MANTATLPSQDTMADISNRSISRFETTSVYTHPEAKVDIVLVHGLNGQPDQTWTAKNGIFWPLDLLPTALKGAHANILVYGYNADVYSRGNDRTASDNFIHQHAQSLVTNLTFHRRSENTFDNPIIWVCHSLGGILVKRALLYSSDVREHHLEDLRSIFVSTFGLIFLGTPHIGSDAAAWGLILQAMADAIIPKRFFDSESVLLKTLKKDNETLANINSHFLDIYQRFEIHMVRENQKTDIKGVKVIVVDANSAGPPLPGVTYYGIEASHSNMCKFESTSSPGFRNIATTIQQWVDRAPYLIQERWIMEGDESRNRAMARASEIMSSFTSRSRITNQRGSMSPYPPDSSIPGPSFSEDDDCEDRIMGRHLSQRSSRSSLPDDGYNQTTGRAPPFLSDVATTRYRDQSVILPTRHLGQANREHNEENPFAGHSPRTSSIPSMDIATNRLSEDRGYLRHGARHSDTSLEADIGHWAPGLPITSNPASSLRPLSPYDQHLSSYRRCLCTGEALSSSLPNSLTGSTLRPPSSTLEDHTLQPTSYHSSPTPSTSTLLRASRAPSALATDPLARYPTINLDSVHPGYQAWRLSQPGLWTSEEASHRGVAHAPRQAVSSESSEMVRSGSGGIQFHGRLVEFGHSEPTESQTVLPSEIESPRLENGDAAAILKHKG